MELFLLRVVLLLFVTSRCSLCEKLYYDGDIVVAIDVLKGDERLETVLDILNKHIPLQEQDVWKEPSTTKPGFFRLPLRYKADVLSSLDSADIAYRVTIEDIGRLIRKAEEENEAIKAQRRKGTSGNIVGTFPRLAEVIEWMNNISIQYPELASTFSIGNTAFGRPQQVLKLGLNGGNKWRVWVDGAMHAREWLSPTTAIYITDQLIQGYANGDPEIINFLTILDFHILIISNPDGYEYTHTDDRLWRKNRRPTTDTCTGVDINRNFAFQWGGTGASPVPCDNTYMGPYAESERETVNIVNYVLPEASKYIWYMAYHTWGKQFFTRWDYTGSEVPPDHQELLDLVQRTVNAIIAVNGEFYEGGTAPDLMYTFSGSSSDWSRGTANIKYPYLVELRDDGTYGFVAPPEEIIPCGEENWAGAQVILREIVANYGATPPPSD